jgi:hypothetical protein
MQQLQIWFGVDWPNWPVQLVGTPILVAPIVGRRSKWAESDFRRSCRCFYMVIQPQAESPFRHCRHRYRDLVRDDAVSWAHCTVMALTILLVSSAPPASSPGARPGGAGSHNGRRLASQRIVMQVAARRMLRAGCEVLDSWIKSRAPNTNT